jgi:hypothetical protein
MEKTFAEAEPRRSPFVWVTWLTKLLAGENECEWALWFRSRYKFDKLASGFDLDRWRSEHDALVQWRAEKQREQGFEVRVEDENGFRVEGQSGTTIAGKPDLAIFAEDSVTYEDCKTGKRRDSDHIQVLLYAMLTRKYLKSPISGAVVYTDGIEQVDMERLPALTEAFKAIMARVNADTPPPRKPSAAECRYCDIPKFYCPDRIQDTSDRVYQDGDF